jgi:hypothetical protein
MFLKVSNLHLLNFTSYEHMLELIEGNSGDYGKKSKDH